LEKTRCNKRWAQAKIIEYILLQKERYRRGELSAATVHNFNKPVKLFLEMNDVSLNWSKIKRILPPAKRVASSSSSVSMIAFL